MTQNKLEFAFSTTQKNFYKKIKNKISCPKKIPGFSTAENLYYS
jgi:hypothetical protein